MLATYEADDELQRINALIKQPDEQKIQKLLAPCREKLSTFSLDPNGYLYMDDRLVVLKLCDERSKGRSTGGTRAAMRHFANHRTFGRRTSTRTYCSLSGYARNARMQVKILKPFDHKVNMANCPLLQMLMTKFLSSLPDRSKLLQVPRNIR